VSNDLPVLLTTKQVADFLGCTLECLYNYRHRGNGPPFVRIGHSFCRYDQAKLIDWIAERETTQI